MSVLCMGSIVMDVLARPADDIVWGGTLWVDTITQSLGGNGAATSAALARLGVPVKLIGAVGEDLFGTAALKRIEECGVDTRFVLRLPHPTAATVVLVRSDGTRAFLHRPGVSRFLFAENAVLSEEQLQGATRLHVGNPFALPGLRSKAPELLRQAKHHGLETSLDTAWDAMGEWMQILGPCLPHTDLLFLNEDEARMLTGTSEPAQVARLLRDAGARCVALKQGSQGCAVFTSEGQWRLPAFRVEAVDTTGAGDCFAGGFLAALERGLPIADAARVANAVGALNVQSLGGTSGLRSWEETLEWMRNQGGSP
ncbi:MAG: carbohydrate kinase family protein [Acidobacteria bacterium]|nr:carbohydrate kinase family protein [Acidobacteriota bacterium]